MAHLRTISGHVLPLPHTRVSLGESAANEVPIVCGMGLAAVHFRLQPWEKGHFLQDAGSGLGTLVNGKSISWVPLEHGDFITAGELKMVYVKDGEKAPSFPMNQMRELAVEAEPTDAGVPMGEGPLFAVSASLDAESAMPPSWIPQELIDSLSDSVAPRPTLRPLSASVFKGKSRNTRYANGARWAAAVLAVGILSVGAFSILSRGGENATHPSSPSAPSGAQPVVPETQQNVTTPLVTPLPAAKSAVSSVATVVKGTVRMEKPLTHRPKNDPVSEQPMVRRALPASEAREVPITKNSPQARTE